MSISPDQASELVNLAIRTQDHELANFARYCQSVAATSQLGIEPAPGKIAEEIAKGRQELQQQGRTRIPTSILPPSPHLPNYSLTTKDTGPGYGAAFASISRSSSSSSLGSRSAPTSAPPSAPTSRCGSPTNVPLASVQSQDAPSQPELRMSPRHVNAPRTAYSFIYCRIDHGRRRTLAKDCRPNW